MRPPPPPPPSTTTASSIPATDQHTDCHMAQLQKQTQCQTLPATATVATTPGGGGGGGGSMKLSVSMTSLPPPNGQHEVSETALVNLRMERPYNSLKKKRNSERDIWRNSWGSGHSHSSCSIHSNATNGFANGKDDFWAALQTNYNYIMDTNLLDSCKEARCEIDGAHDAMKAQRESDDCAKMDNQSSRPHTLASDPRRLRRWLREMETDMAKSPTLSAAMKMQPAELRKRLREHSDLYRQIVSQTRVVRACIRQSEENAASETLAAAKSSVAGIGSVSAAAADHRPKGDGNIKALERRYHLLYLQAIEVQCLLEGLLGRKELSSSTSRTPSDTDEEPVAKVAKLCDRISPKSTSYAQDYADASRSDDDWTNRDTLTSIQTTGFDADSEGSDNEALPKTVKSNIGSSSTPIPTSAGLGSTGVQLTVIAATAVAAKSTASNFAVQMMDTDAADCNGNSNCLQSTVTTTVIVSSSATPNHYLPELLSTPPTLPTAKTHCATKRTRQPDASKFNRSNRKSKNCAIFYFKHLDTDSENKGWSTQASESFKSGASSEEDEWFYTNVNKKSIDGHADMTDANMDSSFTTQVPVQISIRPQNLSLDVVDSPRNLEKNGNHELTSPRNINGGQTNFNGLESPEINANGMKALGMSESYTMGTPPLRRPYKEITKQYSKESIQQLVMDAETLVREEILMKTPTRNRHSVSESSPSRKKPNGTGAGDLSLPTTHPKIKRVQEWLQHQPTVVNCTGPPPLLSAATTDCEASCEYTESDSAARDSDTSDVPSDSVATCLQDGTISQCTSTEVIGGSADPLSAKDTDGGNGGAVGGNGVNGSAATSQPPKVTMRTKRRNSERPWSVSCLSQLTQTDPDNRSNEPTSNQGLANHSISESALHTLSTPITLPSSSTSANAVNNTSSMKSSDSKNSLKRRRMRARKRLGGRKSETNSNGSDGGTQAELSRIITSTLTKSESFSGQTTKLAENLNVALSLVALPRKNNRINISSTSEMESDDENVMMKPNFRLGAYTTNCGGASKLGSLAALATYNSEKQAKDLSFTGTDNSNFSEQAWDPYQEKYMSEAYSEGFDSDAARRLLEFGDDYRNFLDSQSDCCSSLSAANNVDSSMSPPSRRRPFGHQLALHGGLDSSKSPSNSPSGDDHTVQRRRRALEVELERRRKGSEGSRRVLLDEFCKARGIDQIPLSSSANLPATICLTAATATLGGTVTAALASNATVKLSKSAVRLNSSALNRKSEIDFINGLDRRKHEDDFMRRRLRSINNNDKSLASSSSSAASSASCSSGDGVAGAASEVEDESELRELLAQTRNRLEHTNALRVRSHLLRPEDYAEIIATCRDNIVCLESVLRGPTGTVLSAARGQEIREILSSWESLLHWSENASVARHLQDEMAALKGVLHKLGHRSGTFDSESTIQMSIEELKNEKTQLHTHRSTMLRLNASVHSWLTRQEMKILKAQKLAAEQSALETVTTKVTTTITDRNGDVSATTAVDTTNNLNASSATTMTSVSATVAETNTPSDNHLVDEELHKQLKNEVGDMYSAWDEADQRISNRLDGLTTSLIAWKQFESGLTEFKEALGKDKGALKGLTGALEMGNDDVVDTLTIDVKEVAKRLSEKIENQQQQHQHQQINGQDEHMHLNSIIAALPFGIKSSSNGSLSDSGISDGGGSSDYGLSERERRLSALRRLARQLENALAPGSAALNSISQRMEAAEADLRSLQDTCRQLIVRTAASQQQQQEQELQQQQQQLPMQQQQRNPPSSDAESMSPPPINYSVAPTNGKGKQKRSPQSKRKNRRRSNGSSASATVATAAMLVRPLAATTITTTAALLQRVVPAEPEPDPDDPSDEKMDRKKWARRVAKYALPIQMALVAIICAVCCLEPHCCDTINNMSMSFTPQLRYVKGPPPI